MAAASAAIATATTSVAVIVDVVVAVAIFLSKMKKILCNDILIPLLRTHASVRCDA